MYIKNLVKNINFNINNLIYLNNNLIINLY